MVRVADFVAGFNDVVSDLATVEQYAHDMARPQTLSQKSSIEVRRVGMSKRDTIVKLCVCFRQMAPC